MITNPSRVRSDIIKEILINITIRQNMRLQRARNRTEIDAAYSFAVNATAELQRNFNSDITVLNELADKYKVED